MSFGRHSLLTYRELKVGVERKDYIMSEAEMNSYRLTSMEEPGDERMAQIMREVAEDARESTRRAAERVAAGIEAASHERAQELRKH